MSQNRLVLVLFLVGAIILGVVLTLGRLNPSCKCQPVCPCGPKCPCKPAPAPKKEKLKLYFFSTPGCQPCSALKKVMQDPAVKLALQRYDVDMQPSAALKSKYKVASYPTLIVETLHCGSHRLEGYHSAAKLIEWLNSISCE